jgi:hypothetical protein
MGSAAADDAFFLKTIAVFPRCTRENAIIKKVIAFFKNDEKNNNFYYS